MGPRPPGRMGEVLNATQERPNFVFNTGISSALKFTRISRAVQKKAYVEKYDAYKILGLR